MNKTIINGEENIMNKVIWNESWLKNTPCFFWEYDLGNLINTNMIKGKLIYKNRI